MAHDKETTGSKSTMRRTLMGGAIVSTLLIASLAPASAGCLYPQVRINATYVNAQPSQSATSQLGVNWGGATGSQNTGANLRWAATDDFRVSSHYGGFRQARPEPQANRGDRGIFRGSNRVGTGYDTPRLGAVVLPEAQIRYSGEFGGIRIRGGNQTVQWGQGRTVVLPNVNPANQIDVSRQSTPILSRVPAFNFHRDQSANTRIKRGDVIEYVTPRVVPLNER